MGWRRCCCCIVAVMWMFVPSASFTFHLHGKNRWASPKKLFTRRWGPKKWWFQFHAQSLLNLKFETPNSVDEWYNEQKKVRHPCHILSLSVWSILRAFWSVLERWSVVLVVFVFPFRFCVSLLFDQHPHPSHHHFPAFSFTHTHTPPLLQKWYYSSFRNVQIKYSSIPSIQQFFWAFSYFFVFSLSLCLHEFQRLKNDKTSENFDLCFNASWEWIYSWNFILKTTANPNPVFVNEMWQW
jgi:hypothetical protein